MKKRSTIDCLNVVYRIFQLSLPKRIPLADRSSLGRSELRGNATFSVKQLSPTVLFNYSKQLRTTVLHFSSWVRARFAHVSGLFSTSIRLGFRLDQLLKGMAEQHSEIPEDGLCLLYGRGVGL